MVTSVTQTGRLLTVEFATLQDGTLLLAGFSGTESISSPFSFYLRLLSQAPDQVDPDKVIGTHATVSVELLDGSQRFFNGFVRQLSRGRGEERFTEFQVELVPWLWFLTRRSDCRIFQRLTVPEILKNIFTEFGFGGNFRMALTRSYTAWDYCVQYRETDFSFVSRLMEEEGIFYYFVHEQGRHTLVLGDSPQAFPPCPNQPQARFQENGVGGQGEEVITSWQILQQLRSRRCTFRDYHFELPNRSLEASRRSSLNGVRSDHWDLFDYPGGYAERFNQPEKRLDQMDAEASQVAKLRMEEEEMPHLLFHGSSDCRSFTAGTSFKLLTPPAGSTSGPYVLTSVHHSGNQAGVFFSGLGGGATYINSFTCQSAQAPFRPARMTPKPVVQGPQTAVVVGMKGQEIMTDEYGRVKVQFHWDRKGKKDQDSSCWVRVAQIWAGNRWGASFWPRVGQEVIVDFLEGDPNQPIIVGSVYNSKQMPPYLGKGRDSKHPDNPQVSGIKTCSTPGGEGFNELRFDDTKGKEQLFLRAQADMDVRVGGNQRVSVGNDRHLLVNGQLAEEIDKDRSANIKGKSTVKIGATEAVSIGENQYVKVADLSYLHANFRQVKVDTNVGITVGAAYALKPQNLYLLSTKFCQLDIKASYRMQAGETAVISAAEICLRAGGSFITIKPDGIWINAASVSINSGGEALSVPGCGEPLFTEPPHAHLTDVAPADDSKTGFPSNR